MISRLIEFFLPSIIGIMVHKHETLTPKERRAQESFLAKLDVKKRKTKRPVIVAIIGLVGSGKSSAAKELAGHIGATVIDGDEIRVELRRQRERYEGARKIAENMALEIIVRGGNVILDSDHIDPKKRASIRQKAKKFGAKLIFIRTYTDSGLNVKQGLVGSNLDIMIGRAISSTYKNNPEDFFGGAHSDWQGDERIKGSLIKIREMLRRMPHHYRWINWVGGVWVLKELPFQVFAKINTSYPEQWKQEVEDCAKKIFMF